jgi:predicted NBD/HSP70 family sugar kinase
MSSALATVSPSTTRTLLRTVRAAQPISRAELARRLDISRSSITELVKPLLSAGILREGVPDVKPTNSVGRPPIKITLDAGKSVLLGVNIGVRSTQIGLMAADGNTLVDEMFETPDKAPAALSQIRSSIEKLRSGFPDRKIEVIGVSVPGPTDADRSRLLYAPHLKWSDVAIAEALRVRSLATDSKSSFAQVVVENDATAAATFEAVSQLRDKENGWTDFILVRAGTGIGVGLVLGGEVYRGAGEGGGIVGEFGHMTIVAGGKQCVCGNRGCWERYASAANASSLYAGERMQTQRLRYVDIVARAEAGERRAQSTLEQVGEYLGVGIGNVITGVGIPRVIVSGRIVEGWKFISEPLQRAVERTMAGRLMDWTIAAGVPHGSGLGGALEVAMDRYLTYV